MSRLQTMACYASVIDILSTPDYVIAGWIDQPNPSTPRLLAITDQPCLPVGHARHRSLLHAAVWHEHIPSIPGTTDFWLLTGWTEQPAHRGHLRVASALPSLGLLLDAWPIVGDLTWDWDHLTDSERSAAVVASALLP